MAKKKPIKIGIVGLGRAGWGMHCKELTGRENKFEIVAGCDLLKPFRDRFQEKYLDAKVYKNYEDMLADPEIEMISVASRTPEHVEHAIMAMKAGKIVFQEKPIAVDYKEAQNLAKA
jgi:scyllo-inositol 2-dehydrogenase (NADP+)